MQTSEQKQAYNKMYWQRLKESGQHKKYAEQQRLARKRYYENNKEVLAQKLLEEKETLGEKYIKKALIHIKSKAKRNNIPFNIQVSDISIPSHCPILGIKLEFNVGGARDNSPSIDRIVPELGYIPGNIVVISSRANRIKNNATLEEMFAIWNFYNER